MNVSVGKAAVRSEINVTPLVDVCLVLLIIFMVITPMLQRESRVLLPEMGSPGRAPEQSRQLAVAMREDGTVLVDTTPVAQSELTGLLRQLRAADPDRPVIVQGDRRLRYDQISRLIESIEDAGFQRVGLITERQGGGAVR
jgi:biopolymer transport protein ExbD